MRLKITWRPKGTDQDQFMIKDFSGKDPEEEAKAYAKKYCPGEIHDIEEVNHEGKNKDLQPESEEDPGHD